MPGRDPGNSGGLPCALDEPIRELAQYLGGGDELPADAKTARRILSKKPLTAHHVRQVGCEGMATLLYLARRGCRRSAQALVTIALAAERPYMEKVQQFTAPQAAQALFEEYLAQGMTEAEARAMVAPDATPALALSATPDEED